MKLSLITTGRDDNYGGNFLERMQKSLEINCKLLTDAGIDYEYLVVEWNPLPDRKYLSQGQFKELFDKYNLRDIIVDKSVVAAEKLCDNVYYEYFAKNVGLRLARGEFILIINSDVFMTDKTVAELKGIIDQPANDNIFYRARYRGEATAPIGLENLHNYHVTDLHNPQLPDGHLCGSYSGDWLLLTKKCLMERGLGYNELADGHRHTFQTGCDGEMLWNLWYRGAKMEFVNSPYYHILHGKGDRAYDNIYMMEKYDNKPNWGFVDYVWHLEAENCLVLKDREKHEVIDSYLPPLSKES